MCPWGSLSVSLLPELYLHHGSHSDTLQTKSDHITPLLKSLQWHPISLRIKKKKKNQSSYNWPPRPFVILLLLFSLAISPAPQINTLPYCSNKWNLALRSLAVALSTQIRLLLPQPCDGSFSSFRSQLNSQILEVCPDCAIQNSSSSLRHSLSLYYCPLPLLLFLL